MDGHDPGDEDQWWYPDGYYPGEVEAATVPAADAHDNFLDMFANSTEDLFTLAWEGGTSGQPAVSSIPSSPPPAELPRVSLEPPPSNDMMAAWLYPIRRRCKISDRLRTLQQLVPGCDKSNQASTLEHTIQYMKSLQQQVQSMSTVTYPAVPYGAMIPYAHYHAVMMPAAAASSSLPAMMPAPATSAAPEGQCSISTEEQQRKHKKEKRRL
ncbi:unnamed protein product [Alopecurus aequalis]